MPTDNPFLTPHTTPHGAIPFDKIRLEHYEPALMEGIRQDNEEIRAITDNPEPPTFDNTIAALDYGGRLLEEVSTVMDPDRARCREWTIRLRRLCRPRGPSR